MLVHARLPDACTHHAIMCATVIFNILPIKGLLNAEGMPSTPTELFTSLKQLIANLRVFGCPVVVKKCEPCLDCKVAKKVSERGLRAIFIGLPENQKGYLVYVPSTRAIMVSGDAISTNYFVAL